MRSWVRRATTSAAFLAGLAALLLLSWGCTKVKAKTVGDPVGASRSPPPMAAVEFLFSSLDDRPVSSSAFRGKPSVLAFVSSDELLSQAEAGFLSAMAKTDGDRVNYALVAVETGDRRELVESFRAFFVTRFGVSLRTAMADKDTLLGIGPFGDVHRLTVVVLDREGKIAWQKSGVAKAEELRGVLGGL